MECLRFQVFTTLGPPLGAHFGCETIGQKGEFAVFTRFPPQSFA
jgi:hypothetical protein